MQKQLFIGIAFAAASFALGEELPFAAPETVGMSAERLARINSVLEEFVERREVPGFVTLVARRGKIVHWEAHGRREIDSEEPMPKNAIFGVASMTKPITVVSAIMLHEEGRFLMHEPISNYLPEFKNPKVAVGPSATVPAERSITAPQGPLSIFPLAAGLKIALNRLTLHRRKALMSYQSMTYFHPVTTRGRSRSSSDWLNAGITF